MEQRGGAASRGNDGSSSEESVDSEAIQKGPYIFGAIVYCLFLLMFLIWAMIIIFA